MAKLSKLLIIALACVFTFCTFESCRKKGASNPYRAMKVRPSEQQLRENKKNLKKGNRAYKKQLQSNRKHLFGRKRAPGQ